MGLKQLLILKLQMGLNFHQKHLKNIKNQYLVSFLKKIISVKLKKQQCSYCLFCDSMTDGDLIVKDFRTYLQEKFGGQGVGFVNITSESAASKVR